MLRAVHMRRVLPLLGLALLLLGLVIFSFLPRSVQAVPGPPHTVFGSVTVAGSAAADGLEVQARIGGTNYAHSNLDAGNTPVTAGGKYGAAPAKDFQVKADDSGTSGVKEGGADGDLIVFFVNGELATITVVSTGTTCSTPAVVNQQKWDRSGPEKIIVMKS